MPPYVWTCSYLTNTSIFSPCSCYNSLPHSNLPCQHQGHLALGIYKRLFSEVSNEVSKAKKEKSLPPRRPSQKMSLPLVLLVHLHLLLLIPLWPKLRVSLLWMKVLYMIQASVRSIYMYESRCLIIKPSTSAGFIVVIMLKVGPQFVPILTKSI